MIGYRLAIKILGSVIDHIAFAIAQAIIHRVYPATARGLRRVLCWLSTFSALLWQSACACARSVRSRVPSWRGSGPDRYGVVR